MRKSILYIFQAAVMIMLGACAEEQLPEPVPTPGDATEGITVSGSMTVSDPALTPSRGFGDTPGAGLTVQLLEFTYDGDYQNRTLLSVIPATVTGTTAVDNGVEVAFTATLSESTQRRVLHIVVSDGELNVGYGTVATILQSLSVTGGRDAYWGRVAFPYGYCTSKVTTNDKGEETVVYERNEEALAQLKNIPVIRNFAKISVAAQPANFELEGFELINVPDAGTVAPWNTETQSVPFIMNGSGDTPAYPYAMRPYSELASGEYAYSGILSPSAKMTNTEVEASAWGADHTWSTAAQYMYEHPYEAGRRTYMLIAGRYNNSNVTTYYKIDLGANDSDTQVFTPYNIIRNYHYAVNITEVYRAGYATVEEAINGTVFNNLSASTETRDMLSISDGNDLIGVNFTRYVFVDTNNPIEFRYQYRTGVSTGSGTIANNQAKVYGLEAGAVIESFETAKVDGDSMLVVITPKAPTDALQQQTFTVVGPTGLGRTITLISHTPWEMANEAVYKGTENTRPKEGTESDIIGPNQNEALTLFFNLPDGLPEALFPLTFTLEADRQNIENNSAANSTLVVTSGQSLFANDGVNVPRVQYLKTVSYEQYLYESNSDNSVDVNKPNTYHTVRCRFRTTISLDQIPGLQGNTTTTIVRIANPYFIMGSATFIRQK